MSAHALSSPGPALPWLQSPFEAAFKHQHGHALMLQGARGLGQWELALGLAQAWLCETPSERSDERPGGWACQHCAACRLVQAQTNPDLLVLLPPAMAHLWGAAAQGDEGVAASSEAMGAKTSKSKPSQDIRVDDVRRAVAFSQTSSSRGGGKVVVLHPSEALNDVAAHALLKTLEEPPGETRFVLSTAAPLSLLPTLRSRCQAVTLPWPAVDQALTWLELQGLPRPEALVLLAASGHRPQEALLWHQQSLKAQDWVALPQALGTGNVPWLAAWPLPWLIETLGKVCHDALRVQVGSAPRYFSAGAWRHRKANAAALAPLLDWAQELKRCARHAEHPFAAPLALRAWVQQAQRALLASTPNLPLEGRKGQGVAAVKST